jgi:hypothetical protein
LQQKKRANKMTLQIEDCKLKIVNWGCRPFSPAPRAAIRQFTIFNLQSSIYNRLPSLLLAAFFAISPAAAAEKPGAWAGVDETVVERFAAEHGREASPPLLPTDQGDLPLFLFLTAGAIGGFIAGYTFRSLFPPRKSAEERHAPGS